MRRSAHNVKHSCLGYHIIWYATYRNTVLVAAVDVVLRHGMRQDSERN